MPVSAFRLLDSLVVPTFVVDLRGRVEVWNKACERLTDVKASAIVGKAQPWTAFYDSPRPCLADFVAQGRQDELPLYYPDWDGTGVTPTGLSVEMRCLMPHLDRVLHIIADAGAVYDGAGRIVGGIQTLRDVTVEREAHNALQRLASCDGLTGLANRRGFDGMIETEVTRCFRDNRRLSLLMIDVDCFKAFNDTYGHVAGDACLRALAGAIRAALPRANIMPARYGGEEFAVIVPELSGEAAAAVAERIRCTIAALAIPHLSSSAGPVVTVSIGLATRQGHALDIAELLADADRALYTAKRRGRDRLVTAQRPQPLRMAG